MDVSKIFGDGDCTISFEMNEGCMEGVFCKNSSLADLLGSQYLTEILPTSRTVKNSKNVMKSECF